MPSFSNQDIEEAKRRVREMQSRADSFVSGVRKDSEKISESEKVNIPPPVEQTHKSQNESNESSESSEKESLGDSSFIILVLLMLLSHEGADHKLLLALLYLLL